MMLDVAALVDRLLPGLLHGDARSVACICTTRPKYLVFDDDEAHPRCVVEFGEGDRLCRTDRVLKELGARINGTVPASLFCGSVHNGTSVHIQAGLPGVPLRKVPPAGRSESGNGLSARNGPLLSIAPQNPSNPAAWSENPAPLLS